MKKLLIVGYCPSASGEDKPPLCGPRGTGGNLARLMSMSVDEMHRIADCINLFDYHCKKFILEEARWRSERIKLRARYYSMVILLGGDIARAFDLRPKFPLCIIMADCAKYFLLPHPSGRNRWYNDESNRVKAEKKIRAEIKEFSLQPSRD